MPDKMKGYVAQLVETNSSGKRVKSAIVFRPECEVWMPDHHDYLGETLFLEFTDFQEEFGEVVAQQVVDGDVVEVERALPSGMELRGCQYGGDKLIRVTRHNRDGGTQEDLVRRSVAEKYGLVEHS